MLDVRRMRVLREVALRGSFSAAAESLSFTQSAVSQQIAALEREAGAVLVERSARGVRLTEAGEAVVRHADHILGRLSEAEAELEAIAGLRGGRLRLAAFESAAATIMPVAFETDDYTAVQGFVAAGVGVSLIAERGLRTIRDDIVVRPLGRDTPVRQIFATALTGYRSPATIPMIDVLREVGVEHASRRPRLELVVS